MGKEWTKIEIIDESDLRQRFPQFQNLPNGTNRLINHQGRFLRSEMAIAANCYVALGYSAHNHTQPYTDGGNRLGNRNRQRKSYGRTWFL